MSNSQLSLLNRLLAALWRGNSFYKMKWSRAGFTRAPALRLLEQLRDLPLTTRSELQEDQVAHPPPGSNLTFPLAQFCRLHRSSGTRGAPLWWVDTTASWRALVAGSAALFRRAGVTRRIGCSLRWTSAPTPTRGCCTGCASASASRASPTARIMPVRVLDCNGSGWDSDISAGIHYATDNGADVINLSLGGGYSSTIASAVQYATEHGVVVVMAAGNEYASQPGYPAADADKWGIAVGAVDSNKHMADFSNRAGSTPLSYVVAPGVDIYSTTSNNTYSDFSGTSMATPHVAGVAVLVLSAAPNLTAAQVVSLLTTTANPNGITV